MAKKTDTETSSSDKDLIIESLKKELADHQLLITELSEENARLVVGQKLSKQTQVVIAGEVYRIAIPKFRYKNVLRTAEDLLADSKLCAELVASGSKVLKLVK